MYNLEQPFQTIDTPIYEILANSFRMTGLNGLQCGSWMRRSWVRLPVEPIWEINFTKLFLGWVFWVMHRSVLLLWYSLYKKFLIMRQVIGAGVCNIKIVEYYQCCFFLKKKKTSCPYENFASWKITDNREYE